MQSNSTSNSVYFQNYLLWIFLFVSLILQIENAEQQVTLQNVPIHCMDHMLSAYQQNTGVAWQAFKPSAI